MKSPCQPPSNIQSRSPGNKPKSQSPRIPIRIQLFQAGNRQKATLQYQSKYCGSNNSQLQHSNIDPADIQPEQEPVLCPTTIRVKKTISQIFATAKRPPSQSTELKTEPPISRHPKLLSSTNHPAIATLSGRSKVHRPCPERRLRKPLNGAGGQSRFSGVVILILYTPSAEQIAQENPRGQRLFIQGKHGNGNQQCYSTSYHYHYYANVRRKVREEWGRCRSQYVQKQRDGKQLSDRVDML